MAVINGTRSSETLVGTSSSDTITGFAGNDTLTGGDGLDTFVYSARNFDADIITDFVQGQDRIDLTAFGIGEFSQIQPFITQSGTASRLQLFFGGATESITINNILPSQLSASDFIFSTSTTGITYGTTGFSDLILGSLGPDTINGGRGDDRLLGGAGNDTINGGSADDTLTGGAGADVFIYDARNFDADIITDFVQGQDRIDLTAFGIGEFSQIQPFITQSGTASRLQLFFGGAAESITINNILPSQLSASDFIFSTSTTGITYGTTGFSDLILGSLGPDTINGGRGDDRLLGGAGNDTINGGSADDTLTGGAGADVFIYDARNFDADIITDFVQGQDRIDLTAFGIGEFSQIQPFIT